MSYKQAMYMIEQEVAEEEYNELLAEMTETEIGYMLAEQAAKEEPLDFYD